MGEHAVGLDTRDAAPASPLSLHILATTVEGTRSGLSAARRLIRGRDARPLLLVPTLYSDLAPRRHLLREQADLLDQYRTLAKSIGIEVMAVRCVCRRLDDVVHQMVGRSGVVLVGGRRMPLWPSREQRLVARLKLGLSLSNHYELNTGSAAAPVFVDNRFGYFSVAGLVTVPLGSTSKFGAWNLHGGVEVQALGDTSKAFHGGDGSRVIGSVGLGFSY